MSNAMHCALHFPLHTNTRFRRKAPDLQPSGATYPTENTQHVLTPTLYESTALTANRTAPQTLLRKWGQLLRRAKTVTFWHGPAPKSTPCKTCSLGVLSNWHFWHTLGGETQRRSRKPWISTPVPNGLGYN